MAAFYLLGTEVNPLLLDRYDSEPDDIVPGMLDLADAFCKGARRSETKEEFTVSLSRTWLNLEAQSTRDLFLDDPERWGRAARILMEWQCEAEVERLGL